jgi:hypothetical protein
MRLPGGKRHRLFTRGTPIDQGCDVDRRHCAGRGLREKRRLRPEVARKSLGVTYADPQQRPFMSKILRFFSTFPDCSIDFGQFILMFRVDAAQYRNAML